MEAVFARASVTPTFIGGDFNCKHTSLLGSNTTKKDGRHLARQLADHPTIKLLNNGDATHIDGGTLDLSLVSAPHYLISSWSPHPTMMSDHFAINV